jgi:hypothetical protein
MAGRSNLALAYDDLDVAPEPEANPTLTTPTYEKLVPGVVPISKPLPQSDPFTFVMGTSMVTGRISALPTLGALPNVDIMVYPAGPQNIGVAWTGLQNVGIAYSGDPPKNLVTLLPEIQNSMILATSKGLTVARVVRPTVTARVQLLSLEDLAQGWNEDSPAPNTTSIRAAANILDALDETLLSPERVVPDAEGGVAMYFFGGKTLPGGARQQYASISASNDGEIVALVHNRDHEPEAWDVGSGRKALRETAERIRRFIAA